MSLIAKKLDKENTLGLEDHKDFLELAGINYPDLCCSVAWHPEGWDWNNKEMEVVKLSGHPLEYLKDNWGDISNPIVAKWKGREVRWMLVRSQFFIHADMDPETPYAIFQPFIP